MYQKSLVLVIAVLLSFMNLSQAEDVDFVNGSFIGPKNPDAAREKYGPPELALTCKTTEEGMGNYLLEVWTSKNICIKMGKYVRHCKVSPYSIAVSEDLTLDRTTGEMCCNESMNALKKFSYQCSKAVPAF